MIAEANASGMNPSGIALRPILEEEETFKNVDAETSPLIGREGIALSTLRPSGTGVFDEDRIDVVTGGEFIEKETPIRIIEAHGNRIIVVQI